MENNNKYHVLEAPQEVIESSPDKNALTAQKKQELQAIEIQTTVNNDSVEEQPLPTAQYITWGMLCLGWCIALFLYKRNKSNTRSQRAIDRHNTYVKEFKDLLFDIESAAIDYWTSAEDDNDQVKVLGFQRKIKELTTKSKEISDSGGIAYPSDKLKKLRKYVTLDNDQRPLKANSSRIDELRAIVSELSQLYERKSDI
ncbi:hypothetical protein ACSSVW_003251 [Pseudoalteromonas sp. MBR-15]|jgi:hypothetical protein